MTLVESRPLPQARPTRPAQPALTPKQRAIQAIRVESSCDETLARDLFGFFDREFPMEVRKPGERIVHPSNDWLAQFHEVLESVMPDDVTRPVPGSAHDLINRALLPEGQTFVHTKTGREVRYCAVAVVIESAG